MLTIDYKHINIQDNDCILDLGCGEGRHTLGTQLYFPKAYVIGADLSLNDLQVARKKHKSFTVDANRKFKDLDDKNFLYSCADAYNLPFADNTFDHIICSEVLEHLDLDQQALNEMARVLKNGGSLNISVPRKWPEKLCWLLSKEYHQVEGGHVRIFNAKTLQSAVEEKHFSRTYRHWAHALHSPYWWLRCLFWRKDEKNQAWIVKQYHKVLVWDLMKKPWITQSLEKFLNPIMGKSVVLYFTKLENNFTSNQAK